MKKRFFLIISLILANFSEAQTFGIEANYGLNGCYKPQYNGLTHFGGAVTYDFDETYGAKLDFGMDKFEFNEITEGVALPSDLKAGTTNTRVSLQGVLNVSNLLDDRSFYNKFNFLAHAGAGISFLKSEYVKEAKNDNILNIVAGITPRYKVTDNLFINLDASLILNVSQHYQFNGLYAYDTTVNSFTGLMYNATFGIAYKFGSTR